jgi:hypothetical protein
MTVNNLPERRDINEYTCIYLSGEFHSHNTLKKLIKTPN